MCVPWGQDASSKLSADLLSWVDCDEAGVVVPMLGLPSLLPEPLCVGWGWWGTALGRTLCLEAYRKGKSLCHLLSDQETQVSFPSARAGAWEGLGEQ